MTYPVRAPLTAEEEARLGRLARAGDDDARRVLLESVTSMVLQIANAAPLVGSMDREDMQQEAVIAAWVALDTCDVRQSRLSTYAHTVVTRALWRASCEQSHTVRVPEWRYSRRVRCGEPPPRVDVVSDAEEWAELIPDPSPPVEDAVLRRLALDRVMERLSPTRREMLRCIAAGETMVEAGRRTERSRQSVHNALTAARTLAAQEGLGEAG